MTNVPSNLSEDLKRTQASIEWFIKEFSVCSNNDKRTFRQLIEKLQRQAVNSVLDKILNQGHGSGNWRRLIMSGIKRDKKDY